MFSLYQRHGGRRNVFLSATVYSFSFTPNLQTVLFIPLSEPNRNGISSSPVIFFPYLRRRAEIASI
jgi:hypothetical protein